MSYFFGTSYGGYNYHPFCSKAVAKQGLSSADFKGMRAGEPTANILAWDIYFVAQVNLVYSCVDL